jgi:hypothetical protein
MLSQSTFVAPSGLSTEVTNFDIVGGLVVAIFIRRAALWALGLWMLTTVRYAPGRTELLDADVPGMLVRQRNFAAYSKNCRPLSLARVVDLRSAIETPSSWCTL